MFLHKSKRKGGRIYLTLMESYRKDGKTKNKTIKSLGYVDVLEQDIDNPIAYFQAYCEQQNDLVKKQRQSVSVEIHPMQKIDKRTQDRKNIGSAVLLCIYNATHLEQLFRNATRNKKIGFDLNAVVRLLVCERILHPASKISAWQNKDRYFFRSDFEEHDVYRALDLLPGLKKRVITYMNTYIDSLSLRDTTRAYYDVTNYYFEIDAPDDLRKYGVSKEHRKSPIVQMGLLQDKNALPFAYELFSGNTPDCETMLDVLGSFKKDYKLNRVVVVADKGLNTSTNIAACLAKGDGFIYSQSIRGTKSDKKLREWVLTNSDYQTYENGEFKIKSRQGYKTITVETPKETSEDTSDTDKPDTDAKTTKETVDTEVLYVAFWSRKYAMRARYEREKVLEKARAFVKNPAAYNAATHYGAAKYVKGAKFDAKTGEVISCDEHLSLDTEKIKAEEACDGYYLIVTSEYNMSPGEVVDTYRGLWRIEETFKITKSDLKTRPVYCSTPEHIQAHFLICYIALCILRILQLKCESRYSASVLVEQLKEMSGTNIDENWWCFDHRNDITDDVCTTMGLDLSRKFMQLQDIKDILAKANRK